MGRRTRGAPHNRANAHEKRGALCTPRLANAILLSKKLLLSIFRWFSYL